MSQNPHERTCFQTGQAFRPSIDIRADVAIVYGIDKGVGDRIKTWKDRGYDVHVMTGVAWGNYQDYLYGRFDGINHEDEAQTEANGNKVGHGGDVYYMSPGKNYGKFLCDGVQRALDGGANAIHLEEPEFWVKSGWSEGFKREWQDYYHEPWQAPDSSADAQWRASKLKYFLYRRALQQVFSYVQDYNHRTGKSVHCYVPTHSLLNYSHWRIVSPESSLARIDGCDGYIAQVWTGTARTPNVYQGVKKERTFETAFLEYGAMQNLVRATGRKVWYLADPVEDDANHDWGDYRRNYESTLVASLLQPEVSSYEVMPWPERIWEGQYPSEQDPRKRVGIPGPYATELQVVINALKDMNQAHSSWLCGTRGIGVGVSDTLMFERGSKDASDSDMSHFYGLAMPFVKRGMPVQPVQLESLTLPHYLDGLKVLLLSYQGMKPPSPEVHKALAEWVRKGGSLVFVDDDSDPFNRVREWWNSDGLNFKTPREHLFGLMGLQNSAPGTYPVGKGKLVYVHENPVSIAHDENGGDRIASIVRSAAVGAGLKWNETNAFTLYRGPYVITACMDESAPTSSFTILNGNYVNLFDPTLAIQTRVDLVSPQRLFLIDLDRVPSHRQILASSGEATVTRSDSNGMEVSVAGIEDRPGILLIRCPRKPVRAASSSSPLTFEYDEARHLAWIHFTTHSQPQSIDLTYQQTN